MRELNREISIAIIRIESLKSNKFGLLKLTIRNFLQFDFQSLKMKQNKVLSHNKT